MAFATTAKDRTVGELASRLFGVGARSEAGRAAAERLIALNPELKDIKELPEGTLIEVPEVEDAELKKPLPGLPQAASGTLVAGIRASADTLEDVLAETADDARDGANAELKTLRSAAMRRTAKENGATVSLAIATAEAEAVLEVTRSAKAEWRKAAAELRDDLDDLLKLLVDPRAG
jgi:hypothetical protein